MRSRNWSRTLTERSGGNGAVLVFMACYDCCFVQSMPRASKQQARYAVGRCVILWSSNDVTQLGSRPKTKLGPPPSVRQCSPVPPSCPQLPSAHRMRTYVSALLDIASVFTPVPRCAERPTMPTHPRLKCCAFCLHAFSAVCPHCVRSFRAWCYPLSWERPNICVNRTSRINVVFHINHPFAAGRLRQRYAALIEMEIENEQTN